MTENGCVGQHKMTHERRPHHDESSSHRYFLILLTRPIISVLVFVVSASCIPWAPRNRWFAAWSMSCWHLRVPCLRLQLFTTFCSARHRESAQWVEPAVPRSEPPDTRSALYYVPAGAHAEYFPTPHIELFNSGLPERGRGVPAPVPSLYI